MQKNLKDNKVSLIKRVAQMKYGTISMVAISFVGVFYTLITIKKQVIPYYRRRKLQESEMYAEIIYKSESN
ncbi:hypothetical protein KPH14_004918 [Odynerus spinipes]|uniref:Uncharacterized protein n=1 Tax=Odynerus spinipes TaxID=1348599 RepID=A0AAD9RNY2_9HYME|nr:hypothetical protein KPH14_004918 [Odynerus spinipes]